MILYNGMTTPDGTLLVSRHRHDYVSHVDSITGKTYFVDGGHDYVRGSAHGDEKYITVTDNDSHFLIRQYMEWGTRGPKGDQPLSYLRLQNMETTHVAMILADHLASLQPLSTAHQVAFINEIHYRRRGAPLLDKNGKKLDGVSQPLVFKDIILD